MTDDQLQVVIFAAGVVLLLLAAIAWDEWKYKKGKGD